jgi:hypothetical protein
MRDGVYLLFPVVKLPARSVAVAQICLGADVGGTETLGEFLAFVINSLSFLVGGLRGDTARHNNSLDAGYPRRKDESLVIAVDHNHDTYGAG